MKNKVKKIKVKYEQSVSLPEDVDNRLLGALNMLINLYGKRNTKKHVKKILL